MLEWLATIPSVFWTAVLPVLVSVALAVYSGRQARKARASEAEAARLRDLEQQVTQRKIELYNDILSALGNLLTPEPSRPAVPKSKGDPLATAVVGFMNVAIMYGSDEVLRAFSDFRRATSADPPSQVLMRLVADFMLAIREDLKGEASTLKPVDMIAMRINDFDKETDLRWALTADRAEVFKKYDWIPPWSPEYGPTWAG